MSDILQEMTKAELIAGRLKKRTGKLGSGAYRKTTDKSLVTCKHCLKLLEEKK